MQKRVVVLRVGTCCVIRNAGVGVIATLGFGLSLCERALVYVFICVGERSAARVPGAGCLVMVFLVEVEDEGSA